ncbi:MAG: DUF262 domain-containing protein [Rhodospirillaceae bacterium]|nr:DUF262 domain-containing protein [Rhodospirillaceae bacterium]
MARKSFSEKAIEEFYDSGEFRLHQERNDFLLPQIVDFVRKRRWINLHPEYQRRLVWDGKKKSLLIESLLMNVPIPPVFLFEYDLNLYETMDGQQRLNTIVDFYTNRFKLVGLKKWKMLNGRTYDDCPPRIQSGLDRRRLSATILLAESRSSASTGDDVRRTVFERLNTGGQNLNTQELRNCLYSGPFNDLLIRLAGKRIFNELWDMPAYKDNIRRNHVSKALRENRYYKRMTDCEIVLRFFAFRKRSRLRGAVKTILDNCMERYQDSPAEKLDEFHRLFMSRIKLAKDIFGDHTFRIPDEAGRERLSIPLYDATMVALDELFAQRDALIVNRLSIYRGLCDLFAVEENYEIIVGRPNTAPAIKIRQQLIRDLFRANI